MRAEACFSADIFFLAALLIGLSAPRRRGVGRPRRRPAFWEGSAARQQPLFPLPVSTTSGW